MKQCKWIVCVILVTPLLVLQGCTSTPSQLSDDGRSDRIVFPDIGRDAWLKEGTAPGLERLRSVAPGMSKDQLYALLGRPHFQEGFVKVREWDYIFNLPTAQAGQTMSCQYKVVFEPDYRVRAIHWRTPACAELAAARPTAGVAVASPPAPAVVERIVEKATPAPKRIQVAADTLFAYKKYSLGDLLPGGIHTLDQLADELRAAGDFDQVTLTGHSDRIGSDAYNLTLSRERASTVRDYLIAKGIPAQRIMATGLGEAVPLVECPPTRHAMLVQCLKPNRRVEIEAWYTQK